VGKHSAWVAGDAGLGIADSERAPGHAARAAEGRWAISTHRFESFYAIKRPVRYRKQGGRTTQCP